MVAVGEAEGNAVDRTAIGMDEGVDTAVTRVVGVSAGRVSWRQPVSKKSMTSHASQRADFRLKMGRFWLHMH